MDPVNDEFHRARPDGSIWTPNQLWELNPPPCEVYGCAQSAMPLYVPDASGIKCLECKSFHRICQRHITELLNMRIVFQFAKGGNDFVQVICPNEALVGRAVAPTA